MTSAHLFLIVFAGLVLACFGFFVYKRWHGQGALILVVVLVAGGSIGFLLLDRQLEEQQHALQSAQRQLTEFRQNTASNQRLDSIQNAVNADVAQLQEQLKAAQTRIAELDPVKQQLAQVEARLLAGENRLYLLDYPGAVVRKVEAIVPGKSNLAKLLNVNAGWEVAVDASGKTMEAVVNDQTRFVDATDKDIPADQRAKTLQVGLNASLTIDNRGPALLVRLIKLPK